MMAVDKPTMEEIASRKAKIEAGCEIYFKMIASTGRLPNNCWSKIMEDLGSPQWMKRHHLYNEITKRKRRQEPNTRIGITTPIAPIVNKSVITKSNDDVSEASTLDELVKTIITTDRKNDNDNDNDDVSELTDCGVEDRLVFYPQTSTREKDGSAKKTDLKKVKKKLYATPSKSKTSIQSKRAKVSD